MLLKRKELKAKRAPCQTCAPLLLLLCLFFSGAHSILAQQGKTAPAPAVSTPPPTSSKTAQQPAASGNKPSATLDINARASEQAIDGSIPDDPAVNAVLAPYKGKVRELESPIGKLEGDLSKGGMGGGSLGNFVADALRLRAQVKLGKPVLLAVINSSGLRKNKIAAGNISTADIFQLLPFENALVTLELSGEQLRRFLDVTVERRDAQSGARITYRNSAEKKKNEIVNVKLGTGADEREIDPKATYTIVTIDYLVKRGGDYSVLQEGKNVKELGLTMRDAVLDHVKAETAAGRSVKAMLDGRFRYERNDPARKPDESEEPR
jgi:2',3'-cyclic-nucleotide 2'-phosphodiesterase (5'-nucleotidase family)